MVFKQFSFQIPLRVILLAITIFMLAITVLKTNYFATTLTLTILVVIQIYLLILYINKIIKEFIRITKVGKFGDQALVFNENIENNLVKELYFNLDSVIQNIKNIENQKYKQYQYFVNIMDNINIGIITFNENNIVEIINNQAKKIFNIRNITYINELDSFYPGITSEIKKIRNEETKVINITNSKKQQKAIFQHITLKIENSTINLVAIQDIKEELDNNEIESWQKLIRVLTHEIMNSIAPITSVTSHTSYLLNHYDAKTLEKEQVEELLDEIYEGLQIIEKRSLNLQNFVKNFRSLTLLPTPVKKYCSVKDLFQGIVLLFKPELDEKEIKISVFIEPENLKIFIDEKLIEQVLINLLKNAIYAVDEYANKHIIFEAYTYQPNGIVIVCKDSGMGIPEEMLDKIFIPFFTTKSSGSGIGLSLSRQIISIHNGTLKVSTTKDKYTAFTIWLPDNN